MDPNGDWSSMTREEFLVASSTSDRLLEIGPGASPIFAGPTVEYLDVLDSAGLRERMASHGHNVTNVPEVIHHVSPDGRLSVAPTNFGFIASSHNIEHHPDIIRHLQEAGERLRPGGAYLLIIPDKRYCFDHFIPESNLADAVGAWLEQRKVHSPRSLLADRSLTTHNDAGRHWAGDHGEPKGLTQALWAIDEWNFSNGAYIDVHAWQFTPQSFRKLMQDLRALKLTPFEVEFVGETPHGRFEFCARLRKPLD